MEAEHPHTLITWSAAYPKIKALTKIKQPAFYISIGSLGACTVQDQDWKALPESFKTDAASWNMWYW